MHTTNACTRWPKECPYMYIVLIAIPTQANGVINLGECKFNKVERLNGMLTLGMSKSTLKAGSQYDTKQCVALRHLHINACRNAIRCQNRLGSYPCILLRYVLASGHQEIPNFFINKFVHFMN